MAGTHLNRGVGCGADREVTVCPTVNHKATVELRGEVSYPILIGLDNLQRSTAYHAALIRVLPFAKLVR